MAGRHFAADTEALRQQWGSFAWDDVAQPEADKILAKYPAGRQASACLPFLDLAQRQVGRMTDTQGWLPIPVIEFVATALDMPVVRVMEVASFYTMYNLVPVGKYHVQVCGTTPCMLRGSDDVMKACKAKGMKKGHTTEDGLFTLTEVECMGTCANAPMMQVNDDNYEDLTEESTTKILDALAKGEKPKVGSQVGRTSSEPAGGPTTLKKMTERNYDYRGQW
ncbi:complex I 24 kDa subunit family protein [Sphingomicrobium sediminis]|uniref:NAD(P)H-dependent oxidoreductase subunit E n=1 Tax=Sphingomicrobium sediminis TaxID=2950949 RepID=A0A9X2J2H4_9SPHN|nr:NAD(P)H-dependent oxidoreductase subunit E [Sphingomicrobium sediminis]MCM8557035.1 NAD(P)H-dependent oxidoreductase subunit E [Sphingomicrobium sediminis]